MAVSDVLLVSLQMLLIPYWALVYTVPRLRPCQAWTFRQALAIRFARLLVTIIALRARGPALSMAPGSEGDRFAIIEPAAPESYVDVTRADDKISPVSVGVTWYPSRPRVFKAEDRVVLHFHGGAWVLGDGRENDCGFLARTLLKEGQGRIQYVVCPQYRLASGLHGRFPATLQDAISCYIHLLVNEKLQPGQIVLSGDSCGGNIALALLRYIESHSAALGCRSPSRTWLWSPWMGAQAHDQCSNATTDYTTVAFGNWGASCVRPDPTTGLRISDPYIGMLGNPFKTSSRLFLCTGGVEVFADDNMAYVKQMTDAGNLVDSHVLPHAPYDVILMGEKLGFVDDAREGAQAAVRTLDS